MRRALSALPFALILFTPGMVSAQNAPRFHVSINGGVQRSDNTLGQSFSVDKNFEPAPITADIDEKHGIVVDAGVVYRLVRNFGVGFVASMMTHDSDAAV